MFLEILLCLIGGLFLLKIYCAFSAQKCVNNVSLIGKTVLVTGANTGIGFYSALEFAKRGAKVILACRNKEKAERAREDIVKETGNCNVVVSLVDLSSFESIRTCAKEISETQERLDILVNNAGAGGLQDKITTDGFQILMKINYFGPVLFTFLLLGLLKKSPKSRIINVSSIMARIGKLDTSNLNKYSGAAKIYANSKLCNVLFTIKLAEKLKGANISVFSLHPGAVKTDIFKRVKFNETIFSLVAYFTFKTPQMGAQTVIYTATEQDIEKLSGRHFEECEPVATYSAARDPKLADEVWLATLKMLEINEKEFF